MAITRLSLEGYINEFRNTVESTRSKLAPFMDLSTGLQNNDQELAFPEMFEPRIPEWVQDRDLWVQLWQHFMEMKRLMINTCYFMDSFADPVRLFTQEKIQETRALSKIFGYLWLVNAYSHEICGYAMQARTWACRPLCGTSANMPHIVEFIETARELNKQLHLSLEELMVHIEQLKAELANREEDQDTRITNDVLTNHPPMRLLIPHEEIIDDGLVLILKFTSLKVNAGIVGARPMAME